MREKRTRVQAQVVHDPKPLNKQWAKSKRTWQNPRQAPLLRQPPSEQSPREGGLHCKLPEGICLERRGPKPATSPRTAPSPACHKSASSPGQALSMRSPWHCPPPQVPVPWEESPSPAKELAIRGCLLPPGGRSLHHSSKGQEVEGGLLSSQDAAKAASGVAMATGGCCAATSAYGQGGPVWDPTVGARARRESQQRLLGMPRFCGIGHATPLEGCAPGSRWCQRTQERWPTLGLQQQHCSAVKPGLVQPQTLRPPWAVWGGVPLGGGGALLRPAVGSCCQRLGCLQDLPNGGHRISPATTADQLAQQTQVGAWGQEDDAGGSQR